MEQHLGWMEVSRLQGHPRNRRFAREGAVWEEWLEDLRVNGIQTPLTIRPMADGNFQVIKGHRRESGWTELLERGKVVSVMVPVICREMSDEEALKELFRDNLLAERLGPVEEGRACLALAEDLGLDAAGVAAAVGRSVEWVRTRQLMLELGDEVLAAVERPRGEGHLDMGTVEVILELPLEWRAEAVQLVLHHDLYPEPPGAREARTLLRQCITEPKQAEESWNKGLKRVVAEWKRKLREELPKKLVAGMNVQGVPWAEREAHTGLVGALVRVGEDEVLPGAPEDLCWGVVAVRHGLPLSVLPGPREGESICAVRVPVLRALEEGLGDVAWVGRRKRRMTNEECPNDEGGESVGGEGLRQDATATAAALANLEGESDPAWVAEEENRAEAVVIEQVVESHAVVDLGPVRRLREEVLLLKKQCEEWEAGKPAPAVPENWPMWAKESSGRVVSEICDWILGLKRKGGEG